MSKRLRKPVRKRKISLNNYKILSQSANKAFNYKQIEQSWSLMIRKAETKL
jgi:hypothetical protein